MLLVKCLTHGWIEVVNKWRILKQSDGDRPFEDRPENISFQRKGDMHLLFLQLAKPLQGCFLLNSLINISITTGYVFKLIPSGFKEEGEERCC